MRRKEREVTEFSEIIDILERCNTIRVGMFDGEYPYVVPVSFGYEVTEENKVKVYFHGAKEGYKNDLLRENGNVFVEADIFDCIQSVKHGITTRYESIMARGKCMALSEPDDKLKGLQKINEHYGYGDFDIETCGGFSVADVFCIELENLTAKRNRRE